MNTRREFVATAPLGLLAAMAACKGGVGSADPAGATAGATAGGTPGGSAPAGAPAAVASTAPHTGPVLEWIPKHEELTYTFGGVKPVKTIAPGTKIATWTEDCYDGAVKSANDLPSKVMAPGHDNPQTGPFFVEGAEPGDTIAIRILKLEPARTYAVSGFSPGFGAIVGTDKTAILAPDLAETMWKYDVDLKKNVARTKSRDGRYAWEIPLAPFLGCLGVAPAWSEARSTIVPGPFGGNMDCWEVRAGNTVYLGVNVPGALVSFGDGHYAMGEGEIMGAAIEGAMNVEVVVDLVKKKSTPVPRIENASEVMFVGSGRPLEDAARVAFKAMVGHVRSVSGMSELDAYQFVSQNAKAPIIQLVDPEYTVLVKLEKKLIPVSRR